MFDIDLPCSDSNIKYHLISDPISDHVILLLSLLLINTLGLD